VLLTPIDQRRSHVETLVARAIAQVSGKSAGDAPTAATDVEKRGIGLEAGEAAQIIHLLTAA
jgi:hypothetical protein